MSEPAQKGSSWTLLLDYGPLLVFFVAYKLAGSGLQGSLVATFAFMIAVIASIAVGLAVLKRVSPMPVSAYFVAKIAMSMAFAAVVVLLLTACATGLGGVRLGLGQWTLLCGALIAGTLPFCALGLLVGTLAKGQAAVAVVNLVYLPMALLSGLWLPLFVFPAIAQKFAVLWPAFHLGRIALGIVGQESGVDYALHAGVLTATTLLVLSLAA